MKLRPIAALFAAAALGSCGNMAELQPPPGQPLPVKPALASRTPTADELLTPPTYARPERVDELMRRSVPRTSDRFDLPPPDGGGVPALPAGSDPQPVSNDSGPVTPQ